MVFSSVLFLFLFLPAVLILHWLIPQSARNLFLLTASLCFYAWGEGGYILVMLLSIAMNYWFALMVEGGSERKRKYWVSFAVLANLGLLGVFKYANFLVDNVNQLSPASEPLLTIDLIHLPIGISFFTFQAMSYVIEVYRRVAPAQANPLSVGLYIALFPQLIAGPIVRYTDVATQIARRIIKISDFNDGITRFVLGLGKKVLLANPLGETADQIFALPADSLTAQAAWLGLICYSLQIYFDFSGYSDMAIGLGRMFGFKFLENFNYPYISQSIQEFWRRWHISLSSWFRDFLYIPLGGNQRGQMRTYVNLVIVFFLCGLWHGASWNFIVWGLLHGLFLVFERWGLLSLLSGIWRPLRHGYVLLVVMLAWVFFRIETLPEALDFIGCLFSLDANGNYDFEYFFNYEIITILIIGILLACPIVPWLRDRLSATWFPLAIDGGVILTVKTVVLASILVFSSMQIMAGSYNPFIYFRF